MTNNNIYTDNLRELYRELILDLARAPHNFCKMSDATHSAQGINPLCGDKLNIFLNIKRFLQIYKIKGILILSKKGKGTNKFMRFVLHISSNNRV